MNTNQPLSSHPPTPTVPVPQASLAAPAQRGRPKGSTTGPKRGRTSTRGTSAGSESSSPRPPPQDPPPSTSQLTTAHWTQTITSTNTTFASRPTGMPGPALGFPANLGTSGPSAGVSTSGGQPVQMERPQGGTVSGAGHLDLQAQARAVLSLPGIQLPVGAGSMVPPRPAPVAGADEDGEGDDDFLPAMADDDYSAQLSWQSQSKDNLKVLMDNFSPAQYERFEAYRRHALPKQAVRKLIQQLVGQQVSQPVAQIVAGFAKVFVGEIIEKARAVQERRGDVGPLSPDHLREAYRMYQEETGRVGSARPLRAKKLFVR